MLYSNIEYSCSIVAILSEHFVFVHFYHKLNYMQLELDLVCCDSTIIQRISNINTILVNDQLFDKIVHVHIFTAYY